LPPTKDELNLHVKRANYQPAIWRRVTTAYIVAPPPEHHELIVENGSINIKWISMTQAPHLNMYCRV